MKKKQSIEQLKSESLVTTADKVKIPETKVLNEQETAALFKKWTSPEYLKSRHLDYDALLNMDISPKWAKEIEAYCGEMGILPADLIETHKQSLKMARKGLKEGNKGIVAEVLADKRFEYDPNKNSVWLKKMGKIEKK